MANSWGGLLVFGVDDKSRDVVGVPRDRLGIVATWIREICNNAIDPPNSREGHVVAQVVEHEPVERVALGPSSLLP